MTHSFIRRILFFITLLSTSQAGASSSNILGEQALPDFGSKSYSYSHVHSGPPVQVYGRYFNLSDEYKFGGPSPTLYFAYSLKNGKYFVADTGLKASAHRIGYSHNLCQFVEMSDSRNEIRGVIISQVEKVGTEFQLNFYSLTLDFKTDKDAQLRKVCRLDNVNDQESSLDFPRVLADFPEAKLFLTMKIQL